MNKNMMNFSSAKLKFGLFSLAFGVLAAPMSPSEAVSVYKVTDLGILSPGTTDTRANAINNLGQVVGRERGTDGAFHSFVWENGTIRQLSELGYVDIVARSINDHGTIVGTVDPTTVGSDIEQGFIWTENGSGGYDGAYYGDYPNSLEKYFRDINNNNQVAGNFVFSRGANGVSQAYYWENNTTTLLPTLGGDVGVARAINDLTQLVGHVAKASDDRTTTAAFCQKDANGNFILQNLGTFGGLQSSAFNINNVSQVVGQYTPVQGQTMPFLWENGIKTDLGRLGGLVGNALGINNQTQIVGFSNTDTNVSHAVLWENGQIFDLNNLLVNGSGWQLTQATSINDKGQIVGYGTYTDSNGQTQTRGFILQSVPESDAMVGILGIGCLGLIRLVTTTKS